MNTSMRVNMNPNRNPNARRRVLSVLLALSASTALAEGGLPPVLVVNATHDLATPLVGARRMAHAFPKASLFTMDVVGHWLYRRGSSEAAMRVIDTYLTSRKG
ncbi:alpha/beta hydrolase [Streptomyces sp. NPDC056831]|uniref:alpha/beta hydrolase n=1 Tax=Streptomyces sp. NPDC056831 TaxID=3345954 RepID=UPI00368552E9